MDFKQLVKIIHQAHDYLNNHAVTVVNQSLTIRNWLYGYYIIEYEQNGQDRAKYGDKLLVILANNLKGKGIKGLSQRNLYNFCLFYLTYPDFVLALIDLELPESILQTLSAKSAKAKQINRKIGITPKILIERLSFSHLIELLSGK